jgi:peptidyl-prolyl cis-trans isomerase D
MMSRLRKLLENWVARVFFVLLFLVFVFWGVSNVVTLIGSNSAVAHVAGKPVDMSLLQAEYQKELAQAMQNNPTQPDQATRQQIAQAAMTVVLRQQVLQVEQQRLGVTVPDSVVRQTVYGVPTFQTNGRFDQAKFTQVLNENGSSPDQFLTLVRQDLGSNQIVQSLVAGVAPPQALSNQIFKFVSEQRSAESVEIAAAAQAPPVLPPDPVLQRYWRNHPAAFTAPEYREAKIVILSPQTLAPSQPVSDAEIQAAYNASYAQENVAATRSVQVITAPDQASASSLAALWKTGANWSAMQAAATKAGGAAVELDKATQVQIPSPALASAVFAAAPFTIGGPLQGAMGYFIFNVINETSGGAPPLSQVAGQIKQTIQLQKAQAQVNQDVDNVQDALAGQTPLDQLPGNLGLVAVEGSLDANGDTPDGQPAPIPGGNDLRKAIIKAIFAAHPGDPAQLINGPDNGYFAFTLDTITPPAIEPYDTVKQKVAAAWLQDALLREAEVKAAALLNAVNHGQGLDAAAQAAGYAVSMLPPVTRDAPPSGVSNEMVQILFSLKPGQATMQQTADGFEVAALASINRPSPADDQNDWNEVVQAMTKSLEDDTVASFIAGLQGRDKVSVDTKLYAQVYQ